MHENQDRPTRFLRNEQIEAVLGIGGVVSVGQVAQDLTPLQCDRLVEESHGRAASRQIPGPEKSRTYERE